MATKSSKSVRKAGRPSKYTPEVVDRICALIEQDHSINQIGSMPDMPNSATIHRWLIAHEDFARRCARAREAQADFVFGANAELERKTLSGEVPPDVARVVLSSRQWRASKLAPKRYGDKVSHEHAGPGGGAIETVTTFRLADLE